MKTGLHSFNRLDLLLHTAWETLSRSFSANSASSLPPELHKITDQGGRPWWYVHDPVTGQTTFLESEQEVDRWREECFRKS